MGKGYRIDQDGYTGRWVVRWVGVDMNVRSRTFDTYQAAEMWAFWHLN